MAELFLKQGHRDQAIAVYQRLLAKEPHNEQAIARLAELRGGSKDTAMTFRELMQQLMDSVPGAMACAVMGFDGIPIDSVDCGDLPVDITTLLTEYSGATMQMRRGGQTQPESGAVEEVTIETDCLTTVLRLLTEEYFVAVVLGPTALVGKARYKLRAIAPSVLSELA